MNREGIALIIRSILSDTLNIKKEKISEESNLQVDLGVDSLDAVEITMDIEEEFDFDIPIEDMDGLIIVKNIIDYVYTRLNNR